MDREELRPLVEHYFHLGFENQVIFDFLNNRHAVRLSLATLKRRLRDYGLSRRGLDVGIKNLGKSCEGKYPDLANLEVTEQFGTR